ncbi:MAG: ABC transporter permease [Acidobacteria bacterium]|nr:ABC transporter permease [Acidobacteriota bacterium]
MSLFSIVVKNLLRRPVRSLLTLVGIAIGIGAVVALTSLAWGFERTWTNTYRARGADLIVAKITSRDPLPTPFPSTAVAEMARLEGVQAAAGVMSDVMSIEDSPVMLVVAWQLDTFIWDHLRLRQGRLPRDDSESVVVLGEIAAELLHKSVGDRLQIETEEFVVSAIVSSAALAENGAVILSLGRLQALTGRPGMVSYANLKLDPALTPEAIRALRRTIEAMPGGFKAFDATEVGQANLAVQAGKAMSLATSLIAIAIGVVGVANTVLMSVFERVHEIGILLALGWRRSRIILMIMIESLLLSLVGGLAGIACGTLALQVLQQLPWFRGRIEMAVTLAPLGAAILVSLALGVLGGVYPAWRGAHMQPTAALRHE